MKHLLNRFLGVCMILALALVASSATAHDTSGNKGAKNVGDVCLAVERAAKPHKAFAVYTDENYSKPPRWMRHQPAKAMVVEELLLFRRGKRIRAAKLMRTSPSGDWTQYFDYCYRADGTLASVLVELRTFLGDVRVVDKLVFGPDGSQLSKIRRIFDLKTKKPITNKRNFQDREQLIFKTTRALVRHARPVLFIER
jgi:hypothetical protein